MTLVLKQGEIWTSDEDWPDSHKPYTDKYFIRTREILEAEGINPEVSLKVFARGEGDIDGLDQAVEVFERYAEPEFTDNGGELYITENNTFETKDPLMIIKGRAQDVVELETMYLGILSHHLSRANGFRAPFTDRVRERVEEATMIYDEVDAPFIYFGARHYHPGLDEMIAGAALEGGAIQTSTDVGSSNIGEEGVGTTPHFLTLVLAHEYGDKKATLKTAELFDEHMDEDIPRTTLVDTFNREITDALWIASRFEEMYGDDWTHKFRVDTCGENLAEGMELSEVDDNDDYRTGTGVRIVPVKRLRDRLIEEGYGDNTEIILSSGFGNPDKALAFAEAQLEYRDETEERFGESYDLFHGIGAGEVADGIFCTADIYAADGEPLAKTGREQDLDEIEQYIDEEMEQAL